jgi:hypothetical protein
VYRVRQAKNAANVIPHMRPGGFRPRLRCGQRR